MRTCILLILACFIIPLFATPSINQSKALQTDADWSVTLYDHGLNALVEISPPINTITRLPDIGYEPRPFEGSSIWYQYFTEDVALSDDRHYVVSILQRHDPYIREAVITDLITGEIRTVETPPLEENEIFVGYRFGAFNPEMTQAGLSYVSHDITSGYGCCGSGGIVVVDLATGSLLNTLDLDATFNRSTAWVDDWTLEGLWFAPRCSTCTPEYTYTYKLWDPITDTTSETDIFNHQQHAERLEATGELLYSENHPDYPAGGPAFAPPLNVVVLYQIDQKPPDDVGQVVYYELEFVDFNARAHWVVNGKAFLVTKDLRHNVVVFRDGSQLTTDYNNKEFFLAPTGDGWITIDRTTNEVHRYVVSDNDIIRQTQYHASGELVVANIQLPMVIEKLPPFDISIEPPQDLVFCSGAMPTQFEAGDKAEVLVDQQVVQVAGMAIGDVDFSEANWDNALYLPLGAMVTVIDGPACTPYGWGYIKVDYQGTIGWMLEVWQTHYYVAPVSELSD